MNFIYSLNESNVTIAKKVDRLLTLAPGTVGT